MASGDIGFNYELTEYREKPGGPLRFKLKVTICNKLARPVKGRLVENPWKKSGSKIYVIKYGYGHDAQSAIGNGLEVELAPKGDKDKKDCVTKTFEFDVRPDVAYTDLYEYDEKGKIKKDYLDGWTQQLESKKIAWLPPRRSQYVALTFPIPYQMALDLKTKKSIRVAVTEVTDLPKGFSVCHNFPSRKSFATLQHGDRQSQGCLTLRQTRALAPGRSHSIRIVQKVIAPAELRDWPPRVIGIDLEGEPAPRARKRASARPLG